MLRKWYGTNDLPFDQDAAYKYVPWIIGLMVFLSILALAGSNLIATQLATWEKTFTRGFTVELPIKYSAEDPLASKQAQEQELLKALQNLTGVESAQLISKSVLSPFLDPFAPDSNTALADVKIRDGYELSLKQAKAELNDFGEVQLRDHREARQSTINFAYTAIFTGILIACFIGIAAVATIIFVTRTGLQVHHKTIEVLHLVGAQHSYIAQQFQHYAYLLARKGGVIGLSLLLGCLCFMAFIIGWVDTFQYLYETSSLSLLSILALTPVMAIILKVFSAHMTVLSTLSKTSSW
jgi:cell division transport system permease protein